MYNTIMASVEGFIVTRSFVSTKEIQSLWFKPYILGILFVILIFGLIMTVYIEYTCQYVVVMRILCRDRGRNVVQTESNILYYIH